MQRCFLHNVRTGNEWLSFMSRQRSVFCNHGFSILELMLTLVIVVIVLVAVLGILNQTQARIAYLDDQMVRQRRAQDGLDRIMDDILNAASGDMTIRVDREEVGSMDTAHLVIQSSIDIEPTEEPDPNAPTDASTRKRDSRKPKKEKGSLRIDWVGVPRYEQGDLVLFRREQFVGAEDGAETPLYIPVCYHLCGFNVDFLDQKNESTEKKSKIRTIEIFMNVLRPGDNDPDRAMLLSRTFCLHRFD